MKKYLKFVITSLILTIVLFEAIVLGIISFPKGVFKSSYQSIIADKYRILQETNEPKIIMVAGSSSAFGLDQKILEEETGYKVVNLGVHAGFGQLFHSELAKENINKGDIVLLGYEYNWVNNFYALGQQLIMTGIDDNVDMYKHIPIKYWKEFAGYIFSFAAQKNSYTEVTGNYSREAFDPESGQMTWPRYYAMSDYYDDIPSYGQVTVLDSDNDVSICEASVNYLKDFKKYAEDKGASVYFVSSPILYDSVSCDVNKFLELTELEEEKVGIPYISDPRLYMFPMDLMSNAVNHCNSEGEKIRSSILADDLRLCGAIESEKMSDAVKTESGETFALVDELPKRFIHKPKAVKSVYSVNESGSVTSYEEGTDYVVDYERGTIRRTDTSAIPNYSDHQVSYVSGKFTWNGDAEDCNPESNRKYQIRVDYEYGVSEKEQEAIADNSSYLSDTVKDKVLNGESISIALCGDSIGAGADTDGQGIFLNYLAESLERYYGIEVNTDNLSMSGSGSDLLTEKLSDIIELHPDVLMIELGMNDHCGEDGASKEKINTYKSHIENAVDVLRENGIDVILVGFPQQNMTWDEENVEATNLYNEALRDIADRKDIYFADVQDIFYRVGNVKPLSRDVMADFIHHPTEWGHKLYYTSIIEAFNFDGEMKPVDLPDYVYAE